MTKYLILTRNLGGDWTAYETFEAHSAGQAVKLAAEQEGDGTYVAIPAKSFKPVTVRTETVTRVHLEP